MSKPEPLYAVGTLVRVSIGSTYSRFGRIKSVGWLASGKAWIYDVGPIDEFAHTNLTGSFNEGQLTELDAVTQLGALVREDRNELRLPGVRPLSDRAARSSASPPGPLLRLTLRERQT